MKISINGKEIEVEGKKTILEAARENQVFIPSLCDHPRLETFSGCRLCIVEIDGRKGFPPSCGTYIEEGMEIKTKTPRLQKLRKQILGLILSEHPNACLVCTEKENCDEYKSTIRKVGEVTGCVLCSNNGRCDLQDVVEALKIKKVKFPSLYRNYDVKKSDPFFDRNYNLCILCGRCVRICHEVRGASTISFVYRGSQAVVGTVLDRPLFESGCQFCGACVDVCPTGSLAERAIKYEFLPDKTVKTICPLCSMGCELKIELSKGKILSSRPSDDGVVNRGQGCVKGRFVIRDLVYSSKRILKPMIRRKKKLEEVGWKEAFDFIAQRLKQYKGKEVALITCPQVTCEESFLFNKFAHEVLKTKNIDSSARYSSLFAFQKIIQESSLEIDLNFKIADISEAKTLFLIGEDITTSHPMVWLEVLKAVNKGAKLIVVSPREFFLNRRSSLWLKIKPGSEFYLFSLLSKLLLENGEVKDISQIDSFFSFKKYLDKFNISQAFEITGITEEELRRASELLLKPEAVFLFGTVLTQSPLGSQSIAALRNLALLNKARLFPLGLENNLRGIFEIEKNSSGKGLTFRQIIQAASAGDIKALYLAGPVPYLKKINLEFLVLQDSFMNENMKLADAVLPATTFAENEGTFINTEGRVQKFKEIIEPFGEAKPDWWIISQVVRRMGYKGFDYRNPSEIMREIRKIIPAFARVSYLRLEKGKEIFIQEEKKREKPFILVKKSLMSVGASKKYPFLMFVDYNLDYYRSLALCEEIRSLKFIRDSRWMKISPEDAKKLKLKEGERIIVESSSGKAKRLVKITESIPKGTVGACFLWSEDSDFSLASLFSTHSEVSHSQRLLPVKIRKGK